MTINTQVSHQVSDIIGCTTPPKKNMRCGANEKVFRILGNFITEYIIASSFHATLHFLIVDYTTTQVRHLWRDLIKAQNLAPELSSEIIGVL